MISHVAGLFTHPHKEWEEIRDTQESVSHLYFAHVLFLALIPPVSMYIGTTKVGWVVGNGDPVTLTESSALIMSGLMYLALLVGVGVMGAFIDWMSRTYDSSPGLARSIVFAAYTATPLFVAGLCALYPNVILVMLVGIGAVFYTVYLLYTGIPIFMKIPEDEGFVYASSILTIGLVMFVALMAITVLIWSFGFGPAYAG
uniref:Yip1 family protein n=1 Tax=Cellvibrio fontiphilus TaxID=1815559 RepID=UPI002B4BDF53|nr:Yip1 family protein [Cellvibrio fontiphilus]